MTCGLCALAVVLTIVTSGTPPEANRLVRTDDEGVLRWQDNGEEVALFGVNYYAPHVFDYSYMEQLGINMQETIDRDLAHFARMGLDTLRLHVFDREITDRDGNLVDNEHLRLLDYLIPEAKKRGIYTVLTPIAWWPTHLGPDGFSNRFTMQQMVTDPAVWEVECIYLKQFMNHVNRYTGMAYKDDPAIPVFELINEPAYPPQTSDDTIVKYIKALADAVRSTGCTKPIFYNGWDNRYAAVRDAGIEGSSFNWYPTGLCANRSLWDNFLPVVNEHPLMRCEPLERRAKIVYEFDAADVPGSYMYPAMARSFRSGGAQIATQFQYDPLPLAKHNVGWKTHYLNLVYAPHKAMSFIIACEAFHRLPRLQDYGPYPDSNHFGPFTVSHEEDSSVMTAEDAYLNSNDTQQLPPAPERLDRIAGCGSSPLVKYPGTGAYFLDRVKAGVWRLEAYPDAVWTADPYGEPSLGREVSTLIWREWPMEVSVPDLGGEFEVVPLDGENGDRVRAKEGRFRVRPGIYLLLRVPGLSPDVLEKAWAGRVGFREYVAPPEQNPSGTIVRHDPVKEVVEGSSVPVKVTVASAREPKRVTIHACVVKDASAVPNLADFQQYDLRKVHTYEYAGEIPASERGRLIYFVSVWIKGKAETFPGSVCERELEKAFEDAKPIVLFESAPGSSLDESIECVSSAVPTDLKIVEGSSPEYGAIQVRVPEFQEEQATGFRATCHQTLPCSLAQWGNNTLIVVRARSLDPQTTAFELGLVQDDGAAYGADFPLTAAWREARIPIGRLRPLWQTKGGSLDPGRIRTLSVLFGTWLFGSHPGVPHAFELERISVRPPSPVWGANVVAKGAPITIWDAEEIELPISGDVKYRRKMVEGMSPDRLALHLDAYEGFGLPPSLLAFRNVVGDDVKRRRTELAAYDTFSIRIRALYPATTGVEMGLIETDGTPWGRVVPITTDWQEIEVPLSSFTFFKHWLDGPTDRGGPDDHFLPEHINAVNLCFGAWLYGEHANEPHGIEIERIELIKSD